MTTWLEAWALAETSGDPAILLATIVHPAIGVVRLANNTDAVVSRGQTFSPSYLKIDWVQDDGTVPRCTFEIPNVSPEIGRAFMRQAEAPEVTLEVINLAYPDEPLARVPRLALREIRTDALAVSGTLVGVDHSAEPLGSIVVLPGRFPALYAAQR